MPELLLAADLPRRLVGLLAARSIVARHSRAIGLATSGPHELLLAAAQNGWVLVVPRDPLLPFVEVLHDAWLLWRDAQRPARLSTHGGIVVMLGLGVANADMMADHLDSLLDGGPPFSNEMYCRRGQHWCRRVRGMYTPIAGDPPLAG